MVYYYKRGTQLILSRTKCYIIRHP